MCRELGEAPIASNGTQVVAGSADKGGEQERVCRSDTRGGSAPAPGRAPWFLCLLSQGTATPQLPEHLPQTQPWTSILRDCLTLRQAERWCHPHISALPPFPKKSPFPHTETPKGFSIRALLPLVPFPKEGRARGAPKIKQEPPQIPAPRGVWVRDALGWSTSHGTNGTEQAQSRAELEFPLELRSPGRSRSSSSRPCSSPSSPSLLAALLRSFHQSLTILSS